MTNYRFPLLLAIISVSVGLTTSSLAVPIDFSEVSLLVRARESEPSILQEVQRRKLVRALTPQQESTLRAQGARDSLVQALRGPGLMLTTAEASAFDARREQAAAAPRGDTHRSSGMMERDNQPADDGFEVFEVSVGHPVNLSQWGGPDYDFAFRSPRRLDDGHEDAVLIDNLRSFTHTATYLGAGRAEDSTTVFDPRSYVSVMDHTFTRGLRIDRKNPVWLKGVPYALYPVYAARGVSLYYISGTSDTVKLAVQTIGR